MTAPFRFKQFTVQQDKSPFKAGTDSVLLGAWAAVEHAGHILDIGTGTGILSLMAAQRNAGAIITAIDIDPAAVEEAAANFADSPWANRLSAVTANLPDYASACPAAFDHIISNPPYFSSGLTATDSRVAAARHQRHGWAQWMKSVALLLRPGGTYACVVPAGEQTAVVHHAGLYGLHVSRKTAVHTRRDLPIARYLLQMTTDPMQGVQNTTIAIYDTEEVYSTEYAALTGAFYLFF